MPVKRRLHKARAGAITAEVVRLYRHALAVRQRAPGSMEAHEAKRAVDRALGWKMWGVSIWDIGEGEIYSRTEPPEDPEWRDDWRRALGQLQALELAVRQQRRQEREARARQGVSEPEVAASEPTDMPEMA
jgi:uncharacterized membrane protein YccC